MGAMSKKHSHHGEGPSQRQLRVGELIRRALSDVVARGVRWDGATAFAADSLQHGKLVGITDAENGSDLSTRTLFGQDAGEERTCLLPTE